MTRQQQLMLQALERVRKVQDETAVRPAYGALCHKLPVLIRRNGLCQAVAFLDSKAAQQPAYELVCQDLAESLGQKRGELVSAVATAGLETYMRLTRTALMASEFHKRFAVSILGIDSVETGGEP